ncbi:MAG: gliding motility-associated C-terminal domain-containing protein [Lewinellaceae bacterium]|nr:gliding motility-associated C-terminal domain-containing protein [Lewinellaceae bacterium]
MFLRNLTLLLLFLFYTSTFCLAQGAPGFSCGFDPALSRQQSGIEQYEQRLRQFFLQKKADGEQPEGLSALLYTVPVVVHIIHNGGAENISDAQVQAAIDHLNAGFAAAGYFAQQGATVNTQIQFCLAKRDPDGKPTTGITRTQSPLTIMTMETDDIATKDLSRWDPTAYVNIWVVREILSTSAGPGVAGYAFFPTAHGQPQDGMICEAGFFGKSPKEDAVLIHEMGHYFGLYHTFQGGCKNDDCTVDGDRVCDTPPDQATHTTCVFNSCSTDVAAGSPFLTDVDDFTGDFMDYSPFDCYHFFTAGQALRMQGALETVRTSLLHSAGCLDPCSQALTASFSAAPNPVQAGEPVVFTNTSTGATLFSWSENGLVFSQNQDASTIFTALGQHTIFLTTGNSDPNCSATAQVSIEVTCPVTAGFTASATEAVVGSTLVFTNISTGNTPLDFEWQINGQSVSTTTDLNFTFVNGGYYTVMLKAIGAYCSTEFSALIKITTACGQVPEPAQVEYSAQKKLFNPRDVLALPGGYLLQCGGHNSRPMVSKWDESGNLLWHKVTTDNGAFRQIQQLPDGNFLLVGQSSGKMLLAKMTPDGDFYWSKTLENTGGDYWNPYEPGATAINPDGSFGLLFNDPYGQKRYLAKISAGGDILWTKNLFQVATAGALRRATDGSGDFLFMAWGNFHTVFFSVSVLRFNQAGQLLKINTYWLDTENLTGFPNFDLNVHADGGYSIFFTDDDFLGSTNVQKYLLRCTATGAVKWAKRYDLTGGNQRSAAYIRAVPDDKGWLMVDSRTDAAGQPLGDFLIRLDADGNIVRTRRLGNTAVNYDWTPAPVFQSGRIRAVRSSDFNSTLELLTLHDSDLPQTCAPLTPNAETGKPLFPIVLETMVFPNSRTLALADAPLVLAGDMLVRTELCAAILPCPEICDNELDDDGDGYVDCFDTDCPCFDPDLACSITPPVQPFSAKIAWESGVDVIDPEAPLFVGNLNPQVDSIPEIILQGRTTGELYIFKGDGSNKANPVSFNPALIDNFTVAPPLLADINADGIPELVLAAATGNIRVYTNYQENQTPPFTLWLESQPAVPGFLSMLGTADFDQDGVPEIFAGNQIFAFDFSNPAAPTLTPRLKGAGNAGAMPPLATGFRDVSAAADLLSRADCNGDPDCDGLELAAGAHIYSIDLDPNDGDGYQIKIKRNLNALAPGYNFSDGFTQIADINLDGQPDIVVNGAGSDPGTNTDGFYVWDKNGLVAFFQVSPALAFPQGKLTIANVFDDRTAGFAQDFPEIIGKRLNPSRLIAYNLNARSLDATQPFWWSVPSDDVSNICSVSAFDFDYDGLDELVSKGDTFLRVIYGGPAPFPPGVDPDTRVWFELAGRAGTSFEGAVVADVDADQSAEIVYAFNPNNVSQNNGRLRVLESADLPWPPARSVWNQFSYFGVNINDDLTVPQIQQPHWLEMGGIGSGKRPFNKHLAQLGALNPAATNKLKVPDMTLTLDSTRCRMDSFDLFLNICNAGSALLPGGTPIAFYLGNPTTIAAPLLFLPVVLAEKLEPGACISLKKTIPATYNETIFAVANDNGTLPTPFDLTADFPATNQPECYYENNLASFFIGHQPLALDLGPDISLCKNSVVALSASPGFQRYRWQDGSTEPDFTAFGPGKYWVDAYDACGFLQTDTVQITLNTLDTLDLPDAVAICDGETIQLAVDGFSKYIWSPADSVSCADCPVVDILAKNSITLLLSAASGDCIVSDSIRITIGQKPTLDLQVQTNVCDSMASLAASATGNGPFQFHWSDFNTDSVRTVTQAGVYTVEVTDKNGCQATDTASIDLLPPLKIGLNSTMPDCASAATGAIDVSVSGGLPPFEFIWSNNAVSEDLTGIPAGNYTLQVTDANGCSAAISETLTDPPAIQLSLQKTDPNCAGEATGAIDLTASGGNGILQFSWSNNTTVEDLSAVPAGDYTLVVTDANGCSATVSETLIDPPAIQLSLEKTDPMCAGEATGSIDLTAAGGSGTLQFSWSNNAVSEDLTGIPAGDYTLVVTDANGCSATVSETLTDPPAIQLSLQKTDPMCAGETTGALDLTATGGTGILQFSWSNNAVSEDLTGIPAGNYTLQITDANGCSAAISETLTDPPAIQLSLEKTDPMCAGEATGAIDLTATGGSGTLQFSWSNTTVEDLTGVPAGDYTLVVTDANGCSATVSETLIDPPAIQLSLEKTDPMCAGEATGSIDLTATGGSGTLQFSWSNNAVSEDITGIPAGDYTLVVTDANGCSATVSETLIDPPAIQLSLEKTDPMCAGETTGALDLTATGGTGILQFSWSNNAVSEDLTGIPAGNYTLQVTDANGCSAAISETLIDPPAMELSLEKMDLPCPGDTTLIDLTASGGTGPLVFSWSTGAATAGIAVTTAGNYGVTATDANGCTVSASTGVAVLGSAPVLTLTTDTLTCRTPQVLIAAASDIPFAQFSWTGPDGMVFANATPAVSVGGVYSVTATVPSSSCTATGFVVVAVDSVAPVIQLPAGAVEIPCGQSSVSIAAAGSSGGTGYLVQWTASAGGTILSGAQSLQIEAGSPGQYYLEIMDEANGCIAGAGLQVTAAESITAEVVTDSVRCFGEENGAIRVIGVIGGKPPFVYSLDNQNFQANAVFPGLAAGPYSVFVRDANDCVFSTEIEVFQPADFSVALSGDTLVLRGMNAQVIALVQPAGFTPTQINWMAGGTPLPLNQFAQSVSLLQSTLFEVSVSNETGCTVSDNWLVQVGTEVPVYAPNAIYPADPDGQNHVFLLFAGTGVREIESLQIFDRWGNAVFENRHFQPNDPAVGWDGTFRGQLVEPGVYVWAAKVVWENGAAEILKGDLTVLR